MLIASPSYPPPGVAIDGEAPAAQPPPDDDARRPSPGDAARAAHRGMRFGPWRMRIRCDAYQLRPTSGSLASALKYQSKNRRGAK